MEKKEKLVVNGNSYNTKDGTAIRDFIHVSDLSVMHVLATKSLIKRVFVKYLIVVMETDTQ